MKAERGTGVELGEAFSKASLIFMRFQRRITLAEKSGKEARAELDRLKALRQPQQTTTETQQLGSFLTTPINPDMGDLEFAQLERPPAPETGPCARPGARRPGALDKFSKKEALSRRKEPDKSAG